MAGGVEYFRHLAVVSAVGVITEGGMGVLMFEGLGLAFVTLVVLSASRRWSRGSEGIVIEVPGRRGKLVPRG